MNDAEIEAALRLKIPSNFYYLDCQFPPFFIHYYYFFYLFLSL